jgi:hypothetical protein
VFSEGIAGGPRFHQGEGVGAGGEGVGHGSLRNGRD